jgi:hypothetical protein
VKIIISLKIDDVKEEARGLLAPCGILCLGCDTYIGEGLTAAKTLYTIWEGWNMIDVAQFMGLKPDGVEKTLKTLNTFIKKYKKGNCPGCYIGGIASKFCAIVNCVKSKGYWTCAECSDYNPESETPCPHMDSQTALNKGSWMKLICTRYSEDTINNLKRCREIGYAAFLREAKERVANGWRTWQIINKEPIITDALSNK